MNEATLIGRLGQDPKIRSLQSGNKVCNLSIATSDRWTDKRTGEKREATEWHRVTIFNEHLISVAERFCKKGDQILVRGKIKYRKWTDNQVERTVAEITLESFGGQIELLGAPSRDNGRDGGLRPDPHAAGASRTPGMSPGLGYGDRGDSFIDDEIPF